MEYVNPLTGFRVDGCHPNEMRQLKGEVGVVARADGSAQFVMGNTRVIAAVYGPQECNSQPELSCRYHLSLVQALSLNQIFP
ncbi:hypothetical protein BS78_04G126200 [Paspalum vaginatum]|nr:hypothetical protein BS78_04G126200 [Paspalum vaginatum]